MSVLAIARMGHPVLLQRAVEVEDISAPQIRELLQNMRETLTESGGVGLAAPQVHVPLRLFLYSVPPTRSEGEDDPPRPVQALINPVIEPDGSDMMPRLEGCLSIPGFRGEVPRYRRVRYSGWDEYGARVEGIASGFCANVMQHEMDHLDGILYPMRMKDMARFGFEAEITRYGIQA